MQIIEMYLQELGQESETTRNIMASVPEDLYGWRAHEKGMSIGELLGHLSTVMMSMPDVLGGESFDIGDRPSPDDPPTSREQVLEGFDAACARATEWVGGLGESAGDTWRLYRGDEEIMAMPRAAAVRFFLFNHLYHHRGQLSAYLRAAGAIVPSVYGPTADVNPFEPAEEVVTA